MVRFGDSTSGVFDYEGGEPYQVELPPWAEILPKTPEDYLDLHSDMKKLKKRDYDSWWHRMRLLGRQDLVFLLSEILSTRHWKHPEDDTRQFHRHPFQIQKCREIQFSPSDTVMIVSRGHGKSTDMSFGEVSRTCISVPNCCIGIFSVTLDVSQKFVGQLMYEFTNNDLLIDLYPEIFWQPGEKKRQWSKKAGFFLKQTMNYKDPTVLAGGLIEGTSTGARMSHMFYDDCVNETVVGKPELIEKATEAWRMSLNLGMPSTKRKYAGTFYETGDTYHHIIESGCELNFSSCWEIDYEKSRFTEEGIPTKLFQFEDKPVWFSNKHLKRLEKLEGPVMFSIQYRGCPSSYEITDFREEWLKFYTQRPIRISENLWRFIIVDPAGSKFKKSKGIETQSYMAMAVVGASYNKDHYLLDGVIDRLTLSDRTEILFDLVRKWKPHMVFYEISGLATDDEHMKYAMEHEMLHFDVQVLEPKRGTGAGKLTRIPLMNPIFRRGKFWLPKDGIPYQQRWNGRMIDIVRHFILKEYLPFPNVNQVDFFDTIAWIAHDSCNITYPEDMSARRDPYRREFYKNSKKGRNEDWMAQ